MAIKTMPFDAAEYLDDPASQAELLADALETGDSAYITHALGVVARARHSSKLQNPRGSGFRGFCGSTDSGYSLWLIDGAHQ